MISKLELDSDELPKSTKSNLRIRDIILGFADFFTKNIDVLPEEDIEYLLNNRFDKVQWRYIKKIQQESIE